MPKQRPQRVKQKRQAINQRIEAVERNIKIAGEYLESGKHADWNGFRPPFNPKERDGVGLPPHRDWVKNVYIPRQERVLNRAERLLQRFALADVEPTVADHRADHT
ncbi:MAG: hypothetical protein AAFX76_04905 [Planctomycetota bacterium]